MPKVPTCGHPDRPVFSKGRCQQCAQADYARERQERQRAKIADGNLPARINPISDTLQLLNKIYAILCAELKPLHTICEGNLSGCTHVATEIHHMKGRRGILLIMSKFFKYLCRNCHDFCTEHSAQAQEMGLSVQVNSQTDYEFTDRELELIEEFGVRLPKDAPHLT